MSCTFMWNTCRYVLQQLICYYHCVVPFFCDRTDALIQSVIKENFRESTILTIAHRLDTVMDSDRIVVIDAGRIIVSFLPSVIPEIKC